MDRIKEIEARKQEIRKVLESGNECDLDALEKELRDLDVEKQQIERRKTLAQAITSAENEPEQRQLPGAENPMKEDPKKEERKAREERGKALKENRSVTVGSSNVILPRHDSDTINPTFNQVSSLLDRVNIKPLPGGESFRQPYETGTADGDYTAEGAAAATADTTFGYAQIGKAKITAYSEESEEVMKLPAADYDGAIVTGVTRSLRKKITKEILVGDGTTNHLTGIFDDGATAIDAATDLEITEITNTTLDDIIYAYGGDEDVEDAAVLILNKKDLKAFAKLRSTDGKKIHEIVRNGNTGTIDGVPYVINSACKAISDSATTAGAYVMAYGTLSSYTMAVFSDVDVQRSTDYKFKEGMIAHKGVVFLGGNVTRKNGFLRIKKDDGI